MQAPKAEREVEARANELYWTSERSVNQIADDLDLSKGALYGLIQPLGAFRSCPACGTEVVWANRTARAKGLLSCPACEWEGGKDDAEIATSDGATASEQEAFGEPGVLEGWSPDSVRVAVGGALLGAAAGLALIFWVRRR